MERLATLDQARVEYLRGQNTKELRRITQEEVTGGFNRLPIADHRLTRGLAALQAGGYGDSPTRVEVQAAVAELDNAAFDIQDAQEQGLASEAEYAQAFTRARLATALSFSLDEDPVIAALEAAYELQMAFV